MNEEQKYQQYLANGGEASFEEYQSVAAMFSPAEMDELAGLKKKDGTQPTEKNSLTVGSATTTSESTPGEPLLPNPIPQSEFSVPMGNEQDLISASSDTIVQTPSMDLPLTDVVSSGTESLPTNIPSDQIRNDGTLKGKGYLGILKSISGKDMTEFSVGVEVNGMEMDIPTIIPTLTQEEVDYLKTEPKLDKPFKEYSDIEKSIRFKAEDYAKKRLSKGLPVFATPEEEGKFTIANPTLDNVGSIPLPTNPIQNPMVKNMGAQLNVNNSNLEKINTFYEKNKTNFAQNGKLPTFTFEGTNENPLDVLGGKNNDIQGDIVMTPSSPDALAKDALNQENQANQEIKNQDKASSDFINKYVNKDYLNKIDEFNPAQPKWIASNIGNADGETYLNQILEREKRGEVKVARNADGQIIDANSEPITDNSNILWLPTGKYVDEYNAKVRDFNYQIGEQNIDRARFNQGNIGNEPEQDAFGEFMSSASKFGIIPTTEEYESLTSEEARNEYLATAEATQNAQKNKTTFQEEYNKVSGKYKLSDDVKIANGFDAVNLLNQGIENGKIKDKAEIDYFTKYFGDKNNVMDFGEYWDREGKAKYKSSLVRENQANYQETRANIWNDYLNYKNDKLGVNQRFLEEAVVQSSAKADRYAQEGNAVALEQEKAKIEGLYSQYEANQNQMIAVSDLFSESNKNFTDVAKKKKEEEDFQIKVQNGEVGANVKNVLGQIPLAIGTSINSTLTGFGRIANAFLPSDNLKDALDIASDTELKVGNIKVASLTDKIKTFKGTDGFSYKEINGKTYGVKADGTVFKTNYQQNGGESDVKEDVEYNGSGLVFLTAKMAADIYMTTGVGKGINTVIGSSANRISNSAKIAEVFGEGSQMAKSASSFARLAKNADNVSVTGWYVQMYNDSYKMAEQGGITDPINKHLYAIGMSFTQSLIQRINPDTNFLKPINTNTRKLARALMEENPATAKETMLQFIKSVADASVQYAKKAGSNVPKEVLEEVIQQGTQDISNLVLNTSSNTQLQISTGQDYEEVVVGTIVPAAVASLLGGSGGRMAAVNNKEIDLTTYSRNDLVTELARDTKGAEIIKDFKESAFFQSQKDSAQKVEDEINTRKKFIDKIPDVNKYSTPSLSEVAPVLQQIEKKKEDLKADDGTFAERINKDIAELTAQANAILDNDLNPTVNAEPTQPTPQPETVQEQTDTTDNQPEQTPVQPTPQPIIQGGNGGAESGVTLNTEPNGQTTVQEQGATSQTQENIQPSIEGQGGAANQLPEMGEGNTKPEQVAQEIAPEEEVSDEEQKRLNIEALQRILQQQNSESVSETADTGGSKGNAEAKSLKERFDTTNKLTDPSELKKGDYAAVTQSNGVTYQGIVTSVGRQNIKLETESDMYGTSELQFPKSNVSAFYKPTPVQQTPAFSDNEQGQSLNKTKTTIAEISEGSINPFISSGVGPAHFSLIEDIRNKSYDLNSVMREFEQLPSFNKSGEFKYKLFPNDNIIAVYKKGSVLDGRGGSLTGVALKLTEEQLKNIDRDSVIDYINTLSNNLSKYPQNSYFNEGRLDKTAVIKKTMQDTTVQVRNKYNEQQSAEQGQSLNKETIPTSNPNLSVRKTTDATTGNSVYEFIDRKTGKVKKVDEKTERKHLTDLVKKTSYPETAVPEGVDNENDYNKVVLSESKNPKEIAGVLMTMPKYQDVQGTKEWHIANNISRVSRQSFIDFSDENNISIGLAKAYFADKGKETNDMKIDVIARNASDSYKGGKDGNDAITTEDVVRFMLDHRAGKEAFYRQKNPDYTSAVNRFVELAGMNPSPKVLKDVLGLNTASEDIEQRAKAYAEKQYDLLSEESQNNLANEYDQWFNSLTLQEQTAELQNTYPDENISGNQESEVQNKPEPSNTKVQSNKNAPNESTAKVSDEKVALQSTDKTFTPIPQKTYDKLVNRLLGVFKKFGGKVITTKAEVDAKLKEFGGGEFKIIQDEGTDSFKKWSNGYDVLEGNEIQDYKTGDKIIVKAYHGTTNEFYEFNSSVKGNIEGHLGKVNYFTTEEYDASGNYLSDGADITGRVDRRQDELEDTLRYDYQSNDEGLNFQEIIDDFNITDEEVNELYPSGKPEFIQAEEISRFLAEKELKGTDEKVLELYVKLNNPVILGKPAWFENISEDSISDYLEDARNEIIDDYGITEEEADADYEYEIKQRASELSGENPLMDALTKALDDNGYDGSLASDILQDIYDNEVDLNEVEKAIRSYDLFDNYDGELAQSQVISDFFKNLGFDSIVLTDVNERFKNMGLHSGVSHIHVFDEFNNQIKLADGSNVEFSESSDIRYMKTKDGEIYGAKFPDGTIYLNPEKVNANTPIHEFSHLWQQLMPARFKKGVELLKNTPIGKRTLAELKANAGYADKSDAELWNEALVTVMGNEGERIFNSPRASKFKEWLVDLFKKLGNAFGIRNLSPTDKLSNFIKGALGEVMGNSTLVPETTLQNGNIDMQIIGEKGASRLADAENIMANNTIAKEMDDAGKDAKTIRLATGWEKGVDGKWRYEIQDIVLNPNVESVLKEEYLNGSNKQFSEKLDWLLQGNELLSLYPELSKVRLVYEKLDNSEAAYKIESNQIIINSENIQEFNSTLIHEIQHAIQNIEGFAMGGNVQTIRKRLQELERIEKKGNDLRKIWDNIPSKNKIESDKARKEWEDFVAENMPLSFQKEKNTLLKQLPKNLQRDMSSSYEGYTKLAGEVEARNIETRANMSNEERLSTLLQETEDIPRDEQIQIFEASGLQESNSGNSKQIPNKILTEIVNAIDTNGNDSGFEKLQNSDWYQNLSDTEQAEFNSGNYVQKLLAVSTNQGKSAEKENTSLKDKIEKIKEKYSQKIAEVKANSAKVSRERIAKIRNIQKQAYEDVVDLVTKDKIRRKMTPAETSRLIKAAAAILNTNQTEKALERFVDLYNRTNSYEYEKQAANDKKRLDKISDAVNDAFSNGETLQDVYDSNPNLFKFDGPKEIARRVFERLESEKNPDPKVLEKSLERSKQVNEAINRRPGFMEAQKAVRRRIIKEATDRQFLPKHILKNIGAKQTYNRMVAVGGASASAKNMYQKTHDKIFAKLTNEDKAHLNEMIKLKRVIAIDENREQRGIDPIDHEGGTNKFSAKKALDQMKEKIGADEFNQLDKNSTVYFDAFKDILKQMKEAGMINDAQYESMADVDYQPRQVLSHLFDMEFDKDGKLIKMTPITGENISDSFPGLSKDQIRSFQEGSLGLIMNDAEALLSNAILGRTKAIFMNRVNKTFINRDFPAAKLEYETLKAKAEKDLTSENKRFIKYFEELGTMVKENPMVDISPSGKPVFMFKDMPSANWKRAYYFENGIRKEFFMRKDLYEDWHDTMAKLDGVAKDIISTVSGSGITKIMATGRNPGFALVNTPRDFGSLILFSEEYSNNSLMATVQVAKDAVKGIREIYRYNNTEKDNILEKYLQYGGGMDFLNTEGETPTALKFYEKIFGKNTVNNKTKTIVGNIFDYATLKSISNYSEMMFRVGTFDRAVNNRLNALGVKSITQLDARTQEDIYIEAVERSRKILDFNQGGRTAKSLEAVIPYLNAATQGGRVLADSITNRPYATTARLLQGAGFLASAGMGMTMLALASFGDDDDDKRTAIEKYLDIKDGLSRFQKRGYVHFFTGKKNENGEYTSHKMAIPQALTPLYAFVDNILDDVLRNIAGRKTNGLGLATDEAQEAFSANVDPIGITDFTKLGTKNPIVKSMVTYASGYDFFRDQNLDGSINKVPRRVEGFENKKVEDFYKKFGLETGFSPVRTKAAVESILTSPDTNPFLSMIYGGIDAAVGYDSGFSEEKGFAKTFIGSFEKRISAETSDYSRFNNSLSEDARKRVEDKAVDDYLIDTIVTSAVKANKDNNGDWLNGVVQNVMNNKSITRQKQAYLIEKLATKYTDLKTKGGGDPAIGYIKYETFGKSQAKAQAIIEIYGRDFPRNKEVMQKLMLNQLLTDDVIINMDAYGIKFNDLKEQIQDPQEELR